MFRTPSESERAGPDPGPGPDRSCRRRSADVPRSLLPGDGPPRRIRPARRICTSGARSQHGSALDARSGWDGGSDGFSKAPGGRIRPVNGARGSDPAGHRSPQCIRRTALTPCPTAIPTVVVIVHSTHTGSAICTRGRRYARGRRRTRGRRGWPASCSALAVTVTLESTVRPDRLHLDRVKAAVRGRSPNRRGAGVGGRHPPA
jgi:hypothetical protein